MTGGVVEAWNMGIILSVMHFSDRRFSGVSHTPSQIMFAIHLLTVSLYFFLRRWSRCCKWMGMILCSLFFAVVHDETMKFLCVDDAC